MTDWMSRERFLQEYELKVDNEFGSAEWGSPEDRPRVWGSEDEAFELRDDDRRSAPDGWPSSVASALSPDQRFLVVATNTVLRVYDIRLRSPISELVGHLDNVTRVFFSPVVGSHLTVVSYSPAEYVDEGNIFIWHLSRDGGPLGEERTPLAVESLVTRALKPITADLCDRHGMTDVDLRRIKSQFRDTMVMSDALHRCQAILKFRGKLPQQGGNPVSHDGLHILYAVHNTTTQGGMRPDEELPQVVLADLATGLEQHRLRGHQDLITYAAWSPDDSTVAVASWDGTYSLWEAKSGEGRHLIGPTFGQNWAGAFSPTGKYVLLSGGAPTKVAIYNVATGKEVAVLKPPGDGPYDWIREISWHPSGAEIAIVHQQSVLLWDSATGEVKTVFELDSDGTLLEGFNSLHRIKWAADGRKLLVEDSENTIFVWDRRLNVKWRMQRPAGTSLTTAESDVHYLTNARMVVAVDDDRKVRYWKLRIY